MNEEMISYCANMERRVNALYDKIVELESIIRDMYHQEGGSQICPHRYEVTQIKRYDNTEIRTYVCSLCSKTYKKVIDTTKGE